MIRRVIHGSWASRGLLAVISTIGKIRRQKRAQKSCSVAIDKKQVEGNNIQ